MGTQLEMLKESPAAPKSDGTKSIPDIVELHLRADKALSAKVAKNLASLFRTVYEQVAQQTKEK
jgi:hypothetical protein